MILQEKWMTLTHLQKLPKNVRDLDKLIVSKGFKNLPKVQKSPNLVTLVATNYTLLKNFPLSDPLQSDRRADRRIIFSSEIRRGRADWSDPVWASLLLWLCKEFFRLPTRLQFRETGQRKLEGRQSEQGSDKGVAIIVTRWRIKKLPKM